MSLIANAVKAGFPLADKAGMRPFSRTVDTQAAAGSEAKDATVRVKFNPDWSDGLTPGTPAAAATVEVDGVNIILRVDAVIERNVPHGGGATVQTMIDAINAPAANGARYWRAGKQDGIGRLITGGLAVFGPVNAMTGYLDSVPLTHNLNNFAYAGINVDMSERGAPEYTIPHGLDADYVYNIQTAPGTPVSAVGRAGGIAADQGEDILPQRASIFRTSNWRREREVRPANPKFVTRAMWLTHNLTSVGAAACRFLFYKDDGDPIAIHTEIVPEATHEVPLPNIECVGPMFVGVNKTDNAAFTGGGFTIHGVTLLS